MYLNDLAYFYYPLPLCLRIGSLPQSPPTLDSIDLAGAYRGGIASLAALFALSVEGDYTALAFRFESGSGCKKQRQIV